MRRVMLAAAMLVMAAHAHAADMPDYLRGSYVNEPATVNWRGAYVGGQGTWAYSGQTFTGSTMDFGVLRSTANTTVLREMDLSAPTPRGTSWRGSAGFGLFTGYNWQWDDVIIGAELSYLHGNFGGGVSTSAQFASSGPLSDGLFHDPRVTSTNSISVTDYATFRGRAGYAFGCYLPYAFGGFALGYSNISTSARIDDFVSASSGGPFFGLPPLNGTSNALHHVIYGYTAGLGFDINLIGGLFMRAEWEYLRFTSQVDTNINSIHLGLAYKF